MSDKYDINIYDEHGNKIGTGTVEREPSLIAQAVGLAFIVRIAFNLAVGLVMAPIIAILFLIKHPKLGLLVLGIFSIL
ncbi:MAG: hypothetical protein KIT87_08210, partial [Anaerolineae bacterium]|nr:hypothetical protein [Anaerolineae bacterium]